MIGVFDSGSGGLSVLRAIRERLPLVDVLYIGDIKNAPYGKKTQDKLSKLTANSIRYLQSKNVDGIVSACNSVSASLVVSMFDVLNLSNERLVEMVGPTVNSFRNSKERVLLCATPTTIRSGIYQNEFHMLGKDIQTIDIPDLAGAIEFGAPEEEIENIIQNAFSNVQLKSFDTLILGCTHYPLVTHLFERVLGLNVRIVDPAGSVALRVKEQFPDYETGTGITRFVITKDSALFRSRVAMLFPQGVDSIEVLEYADELERL